MVVEKSGDNQDVVAYLQSEGTNIFMNTWTPIDSDLDEYKHIVLISLTE